MEPVLDTTQDSPSNEFTSRGGILFAMCDRHAGGTWVLEVLSAGETWVGADDVSFSDVDILQFRTPVGMRCRFVGGDTGGRIYVSNVNRLE